MFYISSQCFAMFNVGLVFPKNSIYKRILDEGILQAIQSGFGIKFKRDINWELMKSSTGKLLQVISCLCYYVVKSVFITLYHDKLP